ncbi:hypothetical protein [Candidatus Methanomassiliicoccus intestinalis]|uniref:hypothetical protein n=1 Tax=Candidatus Methanomassiliicoccus intestinalis TaxID=1406512 RepID=UPI0037DCB97F
MPRVIASKPMTTNRRITIPDNVAQRLMVSKQELIDFIEEDDGRIYIRKAQA